MYYDDYDDGDRKYDRERDYTLSYNYAVKMVKENPDLYMEYDDKCYQVWVKRKSDNKIILWM